MKELLGVTAEVGLAAPGALQRFEGKARRVIDHRR
jgi:phenylacetate-coenzyme A ligase PaaK-like adenylate-forming protein